jgi:hypothetical protein
MLDTENASLALQDMSCPGDRYRIQVRLCDETHWVNSTEHAEIFPAEWAGTLVRELNEVSVGIVYRAALVEVTHG